MEQSILEEKVRDYSPFAEYAKVLVDAYNKSDDKRTKEFLAQEVDSFHNKWISSLRRDREYVLKFIEKHKNHSDLRPYCTRLNKFINLTTRPIF